MECVFCKSKLEKISNANEYPKFKCSYCGTIHGIKISKQPNQTRFVVGSDVKLQEILFNFNK